MKVRAINEFLKFRIRLEKSLLAKKRSYTFGVLTALAKEIFRSRYQAELLSGIFQRAAALGHELKIFTLPVKPFHSFEQILMEHGLDGLFILTWRWINPGIARLVETSRHKRVLVVNDPVPGLGVNCLYTDIDAGMAQAVTHLVKKGRRKIGMLHGPWEVPFKAERKKVKVPFIDTRLKVRGFLRALKIRHIPCHETWLRSGAANSETEGYRVMKKWLREKNLPGAIVCGNDDLAFGALKALKEAGRRVPQDIAVVGFDDNERAKSFSPPLTTVRQPLALMGKDAVGILSRRIECPSLRPVSKRYLPKLIVRKTG